MIQRDAVVAALDQIGMVEPLGAHEPATEPHLAPPAGRRRLCRIQEGQQFVGVCQGLSAHTSIHVDWVRSIFVILSVLTVGLPTLIYLVLAFVLPAERTQADYVASLERARRASGVQADKAKPGAFVKAAHEVEALHSAAGRAFHQVVDGAQQSHLAPVVTEVEAHIGPV